MNELIASGVNTDSHQFSFTNLRFRVALQTNKIPKVNKHFLIERFEIAPNSQIQQKNFHSSHNFFKVTQGS